jgi:hypothetical protein
MRKLCAYHAVVTQAEIFTSLTSADRHASVILIIEKFFLILTATWHFLLLVLCVCVCRYEERRKEKKGKKVPN